MAPPSSTTIKDERVMDKKTEINYNPERFREANY